MSTLSTPFSVISLGAALVALFLGAPGVAAANSPAICVERIEFAGSTQRDAFMFESADRIVRQTATDALAIISDNGAALDATAGQEACPALSEPYTQTFVVSVRTRSVSADKVHEQLTDIQASNMTRGNLAAHQCVLRIAGIGIEQTGLLARSLRFSGLRGIRFEGANGEIFVAAEEPCSLLTRFASAAMNDLSLAGSDLTSCEHSSFHGCGYPSSIKFGP